MALLGIITDRKNPPYLLDDFLFWQPQFKNYFSTEDGLYHYNKLYEIADKKILKSIYGSDWELAMSYCIAHYLTLIGKNTILPSGSSLNEIAGGGQGVTTGVLTSVGVGSFSKSYELGYTISNKEETKFWNQTQYGMALMSLLSSKAVPSIMVVTNGPLYRNSYDRCDKGCGIPTQKPNQNCCNDIDWIFDKK